LTADLTGCQGKAAIITEKAPPIGLPLPLGSSRAMLCQMHSAATERWAGLTVVGTRIPFSRSGPSDLWRTFLYKALFHFR